MSTPRLTLSEADDLIKTYRLAYFGANLKEPGFDLTYSKGRFLFAYHSDRRTMGARPKQFREMTQRLLDRALSLVV